MILYIYPFDNQKGNQQQKSKKKINCLAEKHIGPIVLSHLLVIYNFPSTAIVVSRLVIEPLWYHHGPW